MNASNHDKDRHFGTRHTLKRAHLMPYYITAFTACMTGNNLTTYLRVSEWCDYFLSCPHFWPYLFHLEGHTHIDVLKTDFELQGFDAHALTALLVLTSRFSSEVTALRPRVLYFFKH